MNRTFAAKNTKEAFEERVQQLSDAGHEAALTAAGLMVLGLQEANKAWSNRAQILDEAQHQGVMLESDLSVLLKQAEAEAKENLRKVRSARRQLRSPFSLVHRAAHTLRNHIDAKLEGHCTTCQPWETQEIEVTRAQPPGTEREPTGQPNVANESDAPSVTSLGAAGKPKLPLAGYDALTAKEIVAALSSLSADELLILKVYEGENRGRVTVLRTIERLVAKDA